MGPLSRHLGAVLGAFALVACEPAEVISEPGREPAPAPVSLGPAGLAAADLERGEVLSLACQACHHLHANGGHNIGPNLFAIFGRRAATVPGFEYSDALRTADIVWTAETIDAWLADPNGYVAGSTMAFFGYRSAHDRRDLIAYLMRVTDPAASQAP